jgi:hypothetical protein
MGRQCSLVSRPAFAEPRVQVKAIPEHGGCCYYCYVETPELIGGSVSMPSCEMFIAVVPG